jgi:transposase
MSPPCFIPEFKDKAVRQITERGYSVAELSSRLVVSAHSLYKWVNAVKPDKTDQQASELLAAKSEILRLRAQLHRTEEEGDILKKAARYFAKEHELSTALSMNTDMNTKWPPCVEC